MEGVQSLSRNWKRKNRKLGDVAYRTSADGRESRKIQMLLLRAIVNRTKVRKGLFYG